MPLDSFGQRNVFRPASAVTDLAGWSSVPNGLVGGPSGDNPNTNNNRLLNATAADLVDISSAATDMLNPPFSTGASGRINQMLDGAGRIQRGYIRRAQVSPADPLSRSRLYFMYNPPSITRQYVAYLDQAALDPFNTIYGAGNLVAPPGFLDMSFELFFDRQDEVAMDSKHRGVFVDYEVFDMVVRNVPRSASGATGALQDNGVLLINPRDLTVVFSKDLTIQGRAYNANVSFEKFDSRMTPIRMRIGITIKVLYIGPERPETQAVDFNQESSYKITVPYTTKLGLTTTSTDVVEFRNQLESSIRSGIERLSSSVAIGGALDLSRDVLSDRQILAVVQTIGVPQDQWITAIAVCLAESGGRVSAVGGPNSDGSYDRGLWQINDIHAEYDTQQLVTYPMYNARAMYNISSGGTVWSPWSAYNNAAYQRFLPRAQAAIDAGPENLYNGSDSPVNMLAAQEAANAPGNTDSVAKVLAFAKQFTGLQYVAGGESLVDGCDCSGFVWACYRENGLLTAMHWESRQYVISMMQGWEAHGWDSAVLLAQWSPNDNQAEVQQRLFEVLRPGDLLLRYGTARDDHVSFFSRWIGDNIVVFQQSRPPGYVNETNITVEYGNWFTWPAYNIAVRPRPIGSLNSSRGGY